MPIFGWYTLDFKICMHCPFCLQSGLTELCICKIGQTGCLTGLFGYNSCLTCWPVKIWLKAEKKKYVASILHIHGVCLLYRHIIIIYFYRHHMCACVHTYHCVSFLCTGFMSVCYILTEREDQWGATYSMCIRIALQHMYVEH